MAARSQQIHHRLRWLRPLHRGTNAMARPFHEWCQLALDPEGFVLAAFPWGQKDTVLEHRFLS